MCPPVSRSWIPLVLACTVLAGCGGGSSSGGPSAASPTPPAAGFLLPAGNVVTGQSVQFTDTSSGNPTAWSWSFGDGGTSTVQSPIHSFASAGSFVVSLTASNSGGSTTASHILNVAAAGVPPSAAFNFLPAAPVVGQSVQFTDGSTGNPTSWSWNFGDGVTSSLQSPTHAYAALGSYSVTLTVANAAGSNPVSRVVTVVSAPATLSYPIVDSGQSKCYNATSEITPPSPGQPFYGQDAQFAGTPPSYSLSGDGKTVYDNASRLTWMRGPNTTLATPVKADKKTLAQAQAWVATVNAMVYGGFSDWRLPTMKELYSLMSFKGTDPSSFSGSDTSVLTPFIDTAFFRFAYGDTSQGERVIDSQYASSNVFVVNPAETGSPKLFGLNLADGRIKGYDLSMPGGAEKTFFVQLVRSVSNYGTNSFTDHGDGTVSDAATGLMWTKADNGAALTWPEALAWAQARNAANHLGHSDWRLPNAKELHSLVNYDNAPDFNGKPAIDTAFFTCTQITNENGDTDFPYYWTSTTHAGYSASGSAGGQAVYIPFGRALGWPDGAPHWVDVHGAGCQRSDPKTGPPFAYATVHVVSKGGVTYTGYAFGPQGDAIRGLNFVRLVR